MRRLALLLTLSLFHTHGLVLGLCCALAAGATVLLLRRLVIGDVEGPVDEAALIAFCKDRIAGFKVPRMFKVVESLPRNALGKVQKHLLPG